MARKKIVLKISPEDVAKHGVDIEAVPQHVTEDICRSIYRVTNKFRDLPDRESPAFKAWLVDYQKRREEFLRTHPDYPEKVARMRERIMQGGEA